jgi:hypothetical protein
VKALLAVVDAAGLAASPVHGASAPSPDITTLIKQAVAKIRKDAQFKRAVLLEADGSPKSGAVTSAAGITRWRIDFQNQTTKGSKYRSAYVIVKNGKIGKPVGVRQAFVEDRNINVVPKMTLALAVSKLRKAGHKQAFVAVTLRYPLGPGFHEPLYIFGFRSGTYWSVGTRTGKVKPLQSSAG